MSVIYISIGFILGYYKAIISCDDLRRLNLSNMISLPVCRWPLGRYGKKEKNVFNEQKNAPNVFLI